MYKYKDIPLSLYQTRCGTPKETEDLLEKRMRRKLGRDLRAIKQAAERWMDERGIPHGVFNPWLSEEDFWSARNDDSIIRFIRRQEMENTETYDCERFD